MPAVIAEQSGDPVMPLRGYVAEFHVLRNGRKYGPYHLRRWKVGRKVYKQYVKPHDLEKTKAACQAYKERRKRQREKLKTINATMDNLNYLVHMCNREDRGELRPQDKQHIARIHEQGFAAPGRPRLRTRTISQRVVDMLSYLQSLPATAWSNRKSAIENRQSKEFMVPTFDKKALAKFNKLAKRAFFEAHPETEDQKLARWRTSSNHIKENKPRLDITLPTWLHESDIDRLLGL